MSEQTTGAVPFDTVKEPAKRHWQKGSSPEVRKAVEDALEDIRRRGDAAVRDLAITFDKHDAETYRLRRDQVEAAVARVPEQTLEDIKYVQSQVRRVAEAQLNSLQEFELETLPGVHIGQRNVPISDVGAYIPGGKYPLLASAHMTILTAKVAGVQRVAACTPMIQGEVPDATIAAMHLAGADEIHLLGGIQAVGAMAIGTETIKPVNMLAGPGNAFVAEAKRQLYGEVGIDLFAGPTEVLIVADEHADPFIAAVDLLSQAEHGPDSPAVLITTSHKVAEHTQRHIAELLVDMPTKDVAEPAWRDWGEIHVVEDLSDAYALADGYAFEHVQVLTEEPREALEKMQNYGALFLGEGTCVSYGDKSIGTNHVLPTRGAARYTGGLWVGKYIRSVTYQEVTNSESSAFFGQLTGRAARAERFEGHARSGDVRAAKYGDFDLDWTDHAF